MMTVGVSGWQVDKVQGLSMLCVYSNSWWTVTTPFFYDMESSVGGKQGPAAAPGFTQGRLLMPLQPLNSCYMGL